MSAGPGPVPASYAVVGTQCTYPAPSSFWVKFKVSHVSEDCIEDVDGIDEMLTSHRHERCLLVFGEDSPGGPEFYGPREQQLDASGMGD